MEDTKKTIIKKLKVDKTEDIEEFLEEIEGEFESFCQDFENAVWNVWQDLDDYLIEKFKEYFKDCSEDDIRRFNNAITMGIAEFLNTPFNDYELRDCLRDSLQDEF